MNRPNRKKEMVYVRAKVRSALATYKLEFGESMSDSEALERICEAGIVALMSEKSGLKTGSNEAHIVRNLDQKFDHFASYMIQILAILKTVHKDNSEARELAQTFKQKIAEEFGEIESLSDGVLLSD